jgi:hypothetical protein
MILVASCYARRFAVGDAVAMITQSQKLPMLTPRRVDLLLARALCNFPVPTEDAL